MSTLLDKYEFKTYCIQGDQISINVGNYLVASLTGAGLTDQELADAFGTDASFRYKGWLNSVAQYVGCSVRNLSVPLSPAVTSTNGAGSGSATGDPLPRQVSGLIHVETATGGRTGKGRKYVGFGTEQWNGTDGNLTLGGFFVLDSVANLWGLPKAYAVGLRITGLQPCVRNRVSGNFTPIIKSHPDDRWATQKRRGSFGRQNPIPF